MMSKAVIIFFNLLLASLLVGTMFGIWIGYNPIDLSASAYIEQQQNTIRQLNVLMPLLGLVTIVVTLASAFLQKQNRMVFTGLLISAALLIVSGLITKFGNQPLNATVLTWTMSSPPGDWMNVRDKWWSLHIIRTIIVLFALAIIILTVLKKKED